MADISASVRRSPNRYFKCRREAESSNQNKDEHVAASSYFFDISYLCTVCLKNAS